MSYLVFISRPTGYELRDYEGDPPAVGSEFDHDGQTFLVAKVAPSPLPGDKRSCAYLATS
jgi:hypothetical protein